MTAVTAPLRRGRVSDDLRRRPQLEVVTEPAERHVLSYVIVTIAVLAAAVFGAVALNAMAAAMAVEARALEATVAEGERTHARLVAEVAALEDPARIRAEAAELGLVASGPVRVLVLERALPADGAVGPLERPDRPVDPLKPVLSAER